MRKRPDLTVRLKENEKMELQDFVFVFSYFWGQFVWFEGTMEVNGRLSVYSDYVRWFWVNIIVHVTFISALFTWAFKRGLPFDVRSEAKFVWYGSGFFHLGEMRKSSSESLEWVQLP